MLRYRSDALCSHVYYTLLDLRFVNRVIFPLGHRKLSYDDPNELVTKFGLSADEVNNQVDVLFFCFIMMLKLIEALCSLC